MIRFRLSVWACSRLGPRETMSCVAPDGEPLPPGPTGALRGARESRKAGSASNPSPRMLIAVVPGGGERRTRPAPGQIVVRPQPGVRAGDAREDAREEGQPGRALQVADRGDRHTAYRLPPTAYRLPPPGARREPEGITRADPRRAAAADGTGHPPCRRCAGKIRSGCGRAATALNGSPRSPSDSRCGVRWDTTGILRTRPDARESFPFSPSTRPSGPPQRMFRSSGPVTLYEPGAVPARRGLRCGAKFHITAR